MVVWGSVGSASQTTPRSERTADVSIQRAASFAVRISAEGDGDSGAGVVAGVRAATITAATVTAAAVPATITLNPLRTGVRIRRCYGIRATWSVFMTGRHGISRIQIGIPWSQLPIGRTIGVCLGNHDNAG